VVNASLVNGTTYYFVVSATNSYGESSNSISVSATPVAGYATNYFWTGAVNGNWDVATANWRTNEVSAVFQDGGAVVFDDTALSNTTVNLSAARTPASVTVNNSAQTYTLSGSAIAGAGSLNKSGLGTLTLSGANTFSGGVTNNAGILTLGNAAALGTGILTLNGGTLNNNGSLTLTNNILIAGSGSAIQLGSANNLTLTGGLSGNGSLSLAGDGNGLSIFLSGPNTMAGGIVAVQNNSTCVRFASASAGNANVDWIFNNLSGNHETLDFASGIISFGSISGAGVIQGNVNGSMNITMSVGGDNKSTIFSGIIHDNRWGTGPVSLTKVGSGTLTLTGANDYSGTTTVSNGELVVANGFVGKGNFLVTGGAALGVTNLSSGSAQVSNLTAAAGAALEFQNVGSTSTPLIFASNVTLGGNCTVKITGGAGLVAGGSYPLVSYTGTFGGSFTNLQLQMPYGWRGTLVNSGNQISLANVAVVSTTPPRLSIGSGNGGILFSWPQTNTGWRLLMNTNLAGTNWVEVPGVNVTNLMLVSPTNGSVFFRLVYP
jgi:autotransporter-associated beta strand protein